MIQQHIINVEKVSTVHHIKQLLCRSLQHPLTRGRVLLQHAAFEAACERSLCSSPDRLT
jgi:hypothetical protein